MLTLFLGRRKGGRGVKVSFHFSLPLMSLDVFLSSFCPSPPPVVDVLVDELLLLLPVTLMVHDVVLTSFSFMDDLIFFSFLKDDVGDDEGKDGSCGGE